MEDNGMFILQTQVFLLNTCVYIQCSWNYNLILSEVLIDLNILGYNAIFGKFASHS